MTAIAKQQFSNHAQFFVTAGEIHSYMVQGNQTNGVKVLNNWYMVIKHLGYQVDQPSKVSNKLGIGDQIT